MEVSNGYSQLSSIENDLRLTEPPLSAKNLVELSASNEGHDEVKSQLILEQVFHSNQEGVVALKHNVFLKNGVLYLVLLNQDILSDGLHSIEFIVGFELSQEDLAKGAPSDDHQEIEIFECNSRLVIFVSYKLRVS